MKKIGVLTSGGDAPGMNAALRAVVRSALAYKMQVVGIARGYLGLVHRQILTMESSSVSNIIQLGGTILRTSRCEEFMTAAGQDKALAVLKAEKIEGLVAIGGDGTFRGAQALSSRFAYPVVGVPATIDNDIWGTDHTIGFDSALNTVLDAINKIRDTASAHERIFVIEVMGRSSGNLALSAGLAGGVDDVIIPEIPYQLDKLCQRIVERRNKGHSHSIILVAEGAGSAYKIGTQICDQIKYDLRVTILGHLQRGGSPSAIDRILASKMGHGAVSLLREGKGGKMVGWRKGDIVYEDLDKVTSKKKKINLDLYELARTLAG